MKSEISVVIPTYNGSRFLHESLNSVFNQSVDPLEIIIVDDSSTDNTVEIIKELTPQSPVPIRLIQRGQSSGGPAIPLNTGIHAAKTDLVTLLEQDDIMAENRIEMSVLLAKEFPQCGLIVGRVAELTLRGNEIHWGEVVQSIDGLQTPSTKPAFHIVDCKSAFSEMMKWNFIYTNSNVTIRKSICNHTGYFNPRWKTNADADFELRILQNSPLAITNQVLCGYLSHSSSFSKINHSMMKHQFHLIRLKIGERQKDWAPSDTFNHFWQLRIKSWEYLKSKNYAEAIKIYIHLLLSKTFRIVLFRKLFRNGGNATI